MYLKYMYGTKMSGTSSTNNTRHSFISVKTPGNNTKNNTPGKLVNALLR